MSVIIAFMTKCKRVWRAHLRVGIVESYVSGGSSTVARILTVVRSVLFLYRIKYQIRRRPRFMAAVIIFVAGCGAI